MNSTEQHVPVTTDCWQDAEKNLSAGRRKLMPAIRAWASRQDRVFILQALFAPESPGPTTAAVVSPWSQRRKHAESKEQLRELSQAIAQEFGRKESARDALIVIGRVIEASNRSRQQPLPLPTIPRRFRRQYNPFVDTDVVAAMRVIRALQKIEARWVAEVSTGHVPQELIVLSAILHGDLLHRSMLESLLGRLNTETRCPIDWWGEIEPYRLHPNKEGNTWPFVDLSLSWGASADSELRRWFPDAQTACLLVYAAYPGSTSEEPCRKLNERLDRAWGNLRNELQARGMASRDLPQSIRRLLAMMRLVRRADNFPSLVVGHCSRTIISHALRPSVLPRLAGQKAATPQSGGTAEKSTMEAEPPEMKIPARSDRDYESVWYRDLRVALRGEDTRSVAASIEQLLASAAHYPDSARRIMEFTAFMAANGSAAGNRLKLSSIRTYTSLIARHLGGMIAGHDPATLPITELVSIYDQVLDAAEQGAHARSRRRQVGRTLREFHHFLVQTLRVEDVNPGAVFGIGRDLIAVDANLLTVDEFFQVRKTIKRLAPSPEIAEIALLLISLGFWLGLRRMEAHGLRIKDVAEGGVPILVIRDWAGRHLKTRASARMAPLTLVPPPELADLLKWKETRLHQHQAAPDDYLFALPTEAREVIGIEVFVLIQRAMRQVTNDPSVRYHHLRHSCSNWAFLRLCLSDFAEIPNLFPKLPQTTDLLSNSAAFRRAIYDAFPSAAPELNELPRKNNNKKKNSNRYSTFGSTGQHAFAVAALLGHADPSTTFEHYIHLLDLVTPLYRQAGDFFPLPRKHVIVASRIPESTAYRYGDNLPASAWSEVHGKTQVIPTFVTRSQAHETPTSGWIDDVWRLLHDAETRSIPVEELAADYGYSSGAEVEALLARARALRDMSHPTQSDQPLHTMTSWIPDRRFPDNSIRLACPWYPNHDSDRAVISRLEGAISVLAKENHETAKRSTEFFVGERTDVVSGDHTEILAGHQTGIRPVVFAAPEDAQRYLEFLSALSVQRKNLTDRHGAVIRESEVRFVFYGRGNPVERWKDALMINWRDETVTEDIGCPGLLGILAHFRTASGRQLVGNFGFRFVMLMAAIARPWLRQRDMGQADERDQI